MANRKSKTPEKNLNEVINPGTGNNSRKRHGPLFEETPDTKEIPHFGVERQDNIDTGPDDTGGLGGPDDI